MLIWGHLLLLFFIIQIGIIIWCIGLNGNSKRSTIKMLKEYVGDLVNVKTDAGDISGTLIRVDDEYIQLVKLSKDVVVVPLSSLNGIQREEKGTSTFDFDHQLKKYIGKEVEVFLLSELIQGILKDVNKGYFTVKVMDPGYVSSGKSINLLSDNIEYIQILK